MIFLATIGKPWVLTAENHEELKLTVCHGKIPAQEETQQMGRGISSQEE